MNTNQLTVLWYATAAVVVVLVGLSVDLDQSALLIPAFVCVVALLLYTLKPPKHATPRKLWLRVAVPLAVLGLALWIGDWCVGAVRRGRFASAASENYFPIPPEQVELQGPGLEDYGLLTGWLKNNSNRPISAVDIGVGVKNDRGDTIGREVVTVAIEVEPGMSGKVRKHVSTNPARLGVDTTRQEKWTWFFHVLAVGSRVPPLKPTPEPATK